MASPHVCGGVALYLGEYPNITPEEVFEMMIEDSIADTISGVGTGSPNKFLYVGRTVTSAPTKPPTKPPTEPPTEPPTKPPLGRTCSNGRMLLEIDVTTGNSSKQTVVSVQTMGKDGWAKRRSMYYEGFDDNSMKKLTHCLHPDECYKIAIKNGSYIIKADGKCCI